MLVIDILTISPNIFYSFLSSYLIDHAIKRKFLKIYIHDLNSYGIGRHNKVDDYPYGGGGGMVLCIEPIYKCLKYLLTKKKYDDIIYMNSTGCLLNQVTVNMISIKKNIIILCGKYKGVDQRIIDKFVTLEISIGNYIVSGGEIPGMVMIDAVTRLLPGVIYNRLSILTDSYQVYSNYNRSCPVYTRPKVFKGLKVPDILLSGNHEEIKLWKQNYMLNKNK